MKSIGRCARSQADASSKPGSSRPLMRSRKAVQRSTWRSWKPSGRPRSCETLGLPVDVAQQRDALDELEGEPAPLLDVGVEGGRPLAPHLHGRPAVDEAHQVEGAPEHAGVGADGHRLGVGHVGAGQRLDDAPLAHDARRRATPAPRRAGCAWRSAGRPGAARRSRSGCRPRCSCARAARPWPGPGRPSRRPACRRRRWSAPPLGRAHRFPTSSSRYSAYFALAASWRLGSHWVGQMSSLGL